MGEGFIVRTFGSGIQVVSPTILNITEIGNQISFEIKNNDTETAVILWEVDDTTPDANSLELAGGATSDTITVTGLDGLETYIVYATANVTGKVKSQVSSQSITTSAVVYTAATGGTTLEYNDGDKRYKSHTFNSGGTFTVTTVGDATDDRNKVDYLIVAGGGSGGGSTLSNRAGGGGGAGGFRTTVTPVPSNQSPDAKVVVTATSYSVTIGAGGTSVSGNADGNNGTNSSVAFGTTITSTGGGAGGGPGGAGNNGGSGGGGGSDGPRSGGIGILGQGRNGGNTNHTTPGGDRGAGGGGGAGAVGASVANQVNTGGDGGVGLANNLRTGSNETRATGGRGSNGNSTNTFPGPANTGNGGTGSQNSETSGAGGSGIVVIRYEIAPSV